MMNSQARSHPHSKKVRTSSQRATAALPSPASTPCTQPTGNQRDGGLGPRTHEGAPLFEAFRKASPPPNSSLPRIPRPLQAFFAIFLSAMGAAQAQLFFPDVAKGKSATQRVFTIVDRQPAIDASSQEGAQPLACTGDVELQAVTFAYPQRPAVGGQGGLGWGVGGWAGQGGFLGCWARGCVAGHCWVRVWDGCAGGGTHAGVTGPGCCLPACLPIPSLAPHPLPILLSFPFHLTFFSSETAGQGVPQLQPPGVRRLHRGAGG